LSEKNKKKISDQITKVKKKKQNMHAALKSQNRHTCLQNKMESFGKGRFVNGYGSC
jgi:hypothetical protein